MRGQTGHHQLKLLSWNIGIHSNSSRRRDSRRGRGGGRGGRGRGRLAESALSQGRTGVGVSGCSLFLSGLLIEPLSLRQHTSSSIRSSSGGRAAGLDSSGVGLLVLAHHQLELELAALEELAVELLNSRLGVLG